MNKELELYDKKRVFRVGNKIYIFDIYKKEVCNSNPIIQHQLCNTEKILDIFNKCDYGIKHIIYVPLFNNGEVDTIVRLRDESILGYKSPRWFKCKIHVYFEGDCPDFVSFKYLYTYFHGYKHSLFIPFYNKRELRNLRRLENKRNRLSGIVMTVNKKIENGEVVDVDRVFAFYTFGHLFANRIDCDGYLKLGDYNTGVLSMTHTGKEHTIPYETLIIDTANEFRIHMSGTNMIYKEITFDNSPISPICRIYRNNIWGIGKGFV